MTDKDDIACRNLKKNNSKLDIDKFGGLKKCFETEGKIESIAIKQNKTGERKRGNDLRQHEVSETREKSEIRKRGVNSALLTIDYVGFDWI